MVGKLSKAQIDKLGDRLRVGYLSENDLRLLDEYRRSFAEAYQTVIRTIRDDLHLEPTGRPAKSTTSLIEKLHRESIRLSQVQDIAGCRIVIEDIAVQDGIAVSLHKIFPEAYVVDRRLKPNYGYRAIHVIVEMSEKSIEVQVRTKLQHVWAELSEKFADVIDPTIKYGGGPDQIRGILVESSLAIAELEKTEVMMARFPKQHLTNDQQKEILELYKQVQESKDRTISSFIETISFLERLKGEKQ